MKMPLLSLFLLASGVAHAAEPAAATPKQRCEEHIVSRPKLLVDEWPAQAKGREIDAYVAISYALDGSGKAQHPVVIESSPSGLFDDTTLDLLKRTEFARDVQAERCVYVHRYRIAKRHTMAWPTIITGSWREPANVARDRYRHPMDTLAFFDVKPGNVVIEISPGAGWYSELLAPWLRDAGSYVAATAAAPADSGGGRRNVALQAKFAADPARYDRVQWREYDGSAPVLGTASSADVVLTFRNVHNWVAAGSADAYFQAFFAVLKPGGLLGVVDHRARPGTALEAMKQSGYLTEALVIALATRAGFVLEAKSEVNANPDDSADHPNGVWTLPPTNRHDAIDDAKYRAIGESDRMTLRFRKPG